MRFKTYLSEAAFAYKEVKYMGKIINAIKNGIPLKLGAKGTDGEVKIKYDDEIKRLEAMGPTSISTAEGIVFTGEDGNEYRYTQFFKGTFSGSGSGAGAENTKITEAAQCAFCAMVVHNIEPEIENINKVKQYFSTDATIAEMSKMNSSWVESSVNTAHVIQKNLGKWGLKNFVFHRGSREISLIEDKFKILNKEAGKPFSNINKFTPADIWAISKDVNIEKDLRMISSLSELRDYFKYQFEQQKIAGLSLKKVVSENPPWKIYNMGDSSPAKLIDFTISSNNKLFNDSIDVYLNFNFHNKDGRIQFRSTTGKASGWQGEIKGSEANGGKIGGGVVAYMVKKFLKKELTPSKEVTKLVEAKDQKFYDEFWIYAKSAGTYKISKDEFMEQVKKSSDKYNYSKFCGLQLIYLIRKSPSRDVDALINEMIGYAASATSDSAVFIKIGN